MAIYHSTLAVRSSGQGFEQRDGTWVDVGSGARFVPERGGFEGEVALSPLGGFDTFWYTWSLSNPTTEVMGGGD